MALQCSEPVLIFGYYLCVLLQYNGLYAQVIPPHPKEMSKLTEFKVLADMNLIPVIQ